MEYKYIIQNDKFETRWEDGDNRKIDLSKYFDQFKNTDGTVIVEDHSFGRSEKKAKI